MIGALQHEEWRESSYKGRLSYEAQEKVTKAPVWGRRAGWFEPKPKMVDKVWRALRFEIRVLMIYLVVIHLDHEKKRLAAPLIDNCKSRPALQVFRIVIETHAAGHAVNS